MKRLVCLAAIAFAACSPKAETPAAPAKPAETAAAPATADASTPVTEEGWGPLRIGMTKAEVIAALGPNANPDGVGGPDPESCEEFRPKNAPEGLWVMIEKGKLTRISLAEISQLKTDKGFGLGSSPADIKAAYGAAAKSSPHQYQDKPAEYITVWKGGPRTEQYVEDDTARGIVYEIDGTGKTGAIHAGSPSIQYVEGCA